MKAVPHQLNELSSDLFGRHYSFQFFDSCLLDGILLAVIGEVKIDEFVLEKFLRNSSLTCKKARDI